MIDALLDTYRSFVVIISAAFDSPTRFYKLIVVDLNMKSFIGFYAQLLAIVIIFNEIVFSNKSNPKYSDFDQFFLVIGTMDLFVGAAIASLLFWISLKVANEPAVFSEISKFIFVFYIFVSIVSLLVSSVTTYIEYALTDGYSHFEDPFFAEPEISYWLSILNQYVVPVLSIAFFAFPLYLSTGKKVKVVSCFLVTIAIHAVAIVPVQGYIFLSILDVNY